jgi:hypothetical protein
MLPQQSVLCLVFLVPLLVQSLPLEAPLETSVSVLSLPATEAEKSALEHTPEEGVTHTDAVEDDQADQEHSHPDKAADHTQEHTHEDGVTHSHTDTQTDGDETDHQLEETDHQAEETDHQDEKTDHQAEETDHQSEETEEPGQRHTVDSEVTHTHADSAETDQDSEESEEQTPELTHEDGDESDHQHKDETTVTADEHTEVESVHACGIKPISEQEMTKEGPKNAARYAEAYLAVCQSAGGPTDCTCTTGYKESVSAEDVTEMFFCQPDKCNCKDKSVEDINKWVSTAASEHHLVQLLNSCYCQQPKECACALDQSRTILPPFTLDNVRGCVPGKCICDGGDEVRAPSSKVHLNSMIEVLNRMLKEKIELPNTVQ